MKLPAARIGETRHLDQSSRQHGHIRPMRFGIFALYR
jgi:hypothetical protein